MMMDGYLASNDYRDAENFFFNLNFEILKGCQFSCKGCHVNKELAVPITDTDKDNLFRLLDSVTNDKAYKQFIAFIGPTDFLTADNTFEILTDPFYIKVFNYFKRLSFQTTALNINKATELRDILHTHYKDLELEVNVLIEPEKVLNKKYISTLQNNRDNLFNIINWDTPIRTFAIMNLYNYGNVKNSDIRQIMKNYEYIHKDVQKLFETTIDFNFSFGRKGKNLTKEEFIHATDQIKELFNQGVTKRTVEFIRFSFGKLLDSLIEYQYNWLNGKLYSSPLLYERYASFIDELEINLKEWTLRELEDYEDEMNSKQYIQAFSNEECGTCQYLKMCVDRQIINLMGAYGITKCMVAKDALEVINGVPTPFVDEEDVVSTHIPSKGYSTIPIFSA